MSVAAAEKRAFCVFLCRREAFTLIVSVRLLSPLAIWCRSLLIMIISKSLSCIVHLCNGIFSTQRSKRTLALPPALPPPPPSYTHTLHHQDIRKQNLNNVGVSRRQDAEAQKTASRAPYFKRKNVSLCSFLSWWNLNSRNNRRDKSIFPRPEQFGLPWGRGITLIKLSLYSARLSLIVLASAQLLDRERLQQNKTMTEECRQKAVEGGFEWRAGGSVLKQIVLKANSCFFSCFVLMLWEELQCKMATFNQSNKFDVFADSHSDVSDRKGLGLQVFPLWGFSH